jgi:uncharacterized protein YcbX
MHVAALTRYPVKSMGPEPMTALDVDRRGIVGDRGWAAYTADGGIGSGKTTRRFRRVPGLLDVPVRTGADGVPLLDLDGDGRRVDDPGTASALSERLDRQVTLRAEGEVPHHDDCPVHLVTTASLRQVAAEYGEIDPERLRPNLVIEADGEGFVEDDWLGRTLHVGEVVLRIGPGMPRCVMLDMEHGAAGAPAAPGLLKLLGPLHDVDLGVQADVERTGTIRLGDPVTVR